MREMLTRIHSKAFSFDQLLLTLTNTLRMPKTFFISNLRRSQSVICSLITLIWFQPLKNAFTREIFQHLSQCWNVAKERNARDGKKLNKKTEIRKIRYRAWAKRVNEMNKTEGRAEKGIETKTCHSAACKKAKTFFRFLLIAYR